MIVRECHSDDIQEASALAHRCNTVLGQTSSFMYKDPQKISEGFSESLGKNSVQLVATGVDGLLGYIHVVDDEIYGSGDVLGPFVPDCSNLIAASLLASLQPYCTHIPLFKFNLQPSSFLVPVLVGLGAERKESNYALILPTKREVPRIPLLHDIAISRHTQSLDDEFIELFNLYFADSYISAVDLLSDHDNQYTLLDLIVQGSLIGFACFRASIGYIDFVAVKPSRQGAGFGRYLLHQTIDSIREHGSCSTIKLNVDLESAAALRLYCDLGFEVLEEFASFHMPNNSFKGNKDRNLTKFST